LLIIIIIIIIIISSSSSSSSYFQGKQKKTVRFIALFSRKAKKDCSVHCIVYVMYV